MILTGEGLRDFCFASAICEIDSTFYSFKVGYVTNKATSPKNRRTRGSAPHEHCYAFLRRKPRLLAFSSDKSLHIVYTGRMMEGLKPNPPHQIRRRRCPSACACRPLLFRPAVGAAHRRLSPFSKLAVRPSADR